MAVRSIVDIDVNDGAFRDFQKLFEKYQAQLAKMPESWAAAGKQVEKVESSFDRALAAMLAQAEVSRRIASSQRDADRVNRGADHIWSSMAKSTASVAGNITRATKELLKWGALTGVFSGLLGAGGLFGIDRLAAGVASGRRSSQGLGLSYGAQKAFGVNYGRLVDTDSYLSNVNTTLHDLSQRYVLYGAGLSEKDIRGKDTGQVASALLPQLKRIADQTPDAQLAQVMQARGLNNLITLEDFQRLKATPKSDLASFQQSYERDRKAFGLGDAAQKQWQDFSVQMTRAGQKIENVFVKGLTPLAPALTQLSSAFSKAVESFLASPNLKKWIVELGNGIEATAKYIGSDKFQHDVQDFVTGVSALAESMVKALRFFGLIPDKTATTDDGTPVPPISDVSGRIRMGLGLDRKAPAPANGKTYTVEELQHMTPEQLSMIAGDATKLPNGVSLERDPSLWGLIGSNPNPYRIQSGGKTIPSLGPVSATGNPMLSPSAIAEHQIGKTGSDLNAFMAKQGENIDASIAAWCAAYVNSALKASGIAGDNSDIATDFLKWGRKVKVSDVQRDDVLVQARGHKAGEVGGHVGFATGRTRMIDGHEQIEMISGNHSGKVGRSWLDASVVEIRRAVEKSMSKPAVIVQVFNNTGGSAVVTTNQLAQ